MEELPDQLNVWESEIYRFIMYAVERLEDVEINVSEVADGYAEIMRSNKRKDSYKI